MSDRRTVPRKEEGLTPGRVYLVGAGPGDPALLTIRAAELLRAADVVVFDSLVSPEVLARIGSHARVVEVGRRDMSETISRGDVLSLLIDEGRKGKVVVRLKQGDPFLFGRASQDVEALRAADVPFEIVPGITAAVAAPAYAGIPLTHDGKSRSATFVVLDGRGGDSAIRWEALARLEGTLLFPMPDSEALELVCRRLTGHGMKPATPAAVISQGTTRRQKTVTGTLGTIRQLASDEQISPPSLILVGSVVELQPGMAWFESRPLFGRTVVVTRAKAQAGGLVRLLESEGANVVQFPMIEIVPPESWDSLDAILSRLPTYDWLIFTSTNGVDSFFERLRHHGRDMRALTRTRIAAVGEATAAALHARGILPDLVPEKFQASALLPHFPDSLEGLRVAVVRAEVGREELLGELRSRQATVDLGIAYRTRPSRGFREQVGSMLGSGRIDAITFTSSSTVESFFEQLGPDEKEQVLEHVLLASIGPVTSETLLAHGATATIEAPEATIQSLTAAIADHFRKG